MKYLILALMVFLFAPLVTVASHPHQPLLAQIVSGIDHQQPTGDPPPPAPEKYPGQHEHAQPPEDWFCRRQTFTLDVPEDHACTCERLVDPDDPTVIHEDMECSVWSHPMSCACGISGKPPAQ